MDTLRLENVFEIVTSCLAFIPLDLDQVRLSKVRREPRELGIRFYFIYFYSLGPQFQFHRLPSDFRETDLIRVYYLPVRKHSSIS